MPDRQGPRVGSGRLEPPDCGLHQRCQKEEAQSETKKGGGVCQAGCAWDVLSDAPFFPHEKGGAGEALCRAGGRPATEEAEVGIWRRAECRGLSPLPWNDSFIRNYGQRRGPVDSGCGGSPSCGPHHPPGDDAGSPHDFRHHRALSTLCCRFWATARREGGSYWLQFFTGPPCRRGGFSGLVSRGEQFGRRPGRRKGGWKR